VLCASRSRRASGCAITLALARFRRLHVVRLGETLVVWHPILGFSGGLRCGPRRAVTRALPPRLLLLKILVSRAGVPRGNRARVKLIASVMPGCLGEPCAMQAQTPKPPNRHGRYHASCRQAAIRPPLPHDYWLSLRISRKQRANGESVNYQTGCLGGLVVVSAACC